MKLTAGSTDVHGKTQNTTATNSKKEKKKSTFSKKKSNGNHKNPTSALLSVLGKEAKRFKKTIKKKKNIHG